MRRKNRSIALICLTTGAGLLLAGCGGKTTPKEPVAISIWNYYNGSQLDAFNEQVDLFNETVGKEEGIIVTGYSQGSVSDLQTNVMNAINGKVGAEEVPNIFAAYADTAYEIDQMGQAVDLSAYLTEEQKEKYISSYLEEGDFDGAGSIKIFPIAKSTELFLLNETDWQKFADATGAKYEDFSTMEGLLETAQKYYEWTDSLTEEPNDGKAFFGRDAMANYALIGGMQLGCEIFASRDGETVINFDHDTMRKLWDYYYVPYVKGYFASSGRFRSDDIRIGNIISFVGSSSGATFFPDKVAKDEEEYDISMSVFPSPAFAGGEKYAVQQGAGMVVTKKSEEEIQASVKFLLWFTDPKQNIDFSLGSGYMPVTKDANSMEAIRESGKELSETMEDVLQAAFTTVQENHLYTPKAFKNGVEARNVLEYCMTDIASADREVVVGRLAEGMSLEEAAEEFVSDEYFEDWYQKTLEKLTY